jgi:hypothetical protein
MYHKPHIGVEEFEEELDIEEIDLLSRDFPRGEQIDEMMEELDYLEAIRATERKLDHAEIKAVRDKLIHACRKHIKL